MIGNEALLSVVAVIAVCHLLINAHLSKEIYHWVPLLKQRLTLLLCLWLIPLIGIVFVYKYLDLAWFKPKSVRSSSEQQNVGSAFLEVDAIFNPGQKHVLEAQQKEIIEEKEDGSVYDNNKQDLTKINTNN
ncbi:hypothetical protein [Thalassotalea ganghwensis]